MSTATLEQPVDISKLPTVPQKAAYQKPIIRFELLHGRHTDANPRWRPTHKRKDPATGVEIPVMLNEDGDEVPQEIMYVKGDIIETTEDLLRSIDHNSGRGGVKKFKRVEGDPIGDMKKIVEANKADPVPGASAMKTRWTVEGLNNKSVRELQLICAENKIAYDAGDRKDRLIALIMGTTK